MRKLAFYVTASFECSPERDFIGIFKISAYRQATS
jgi:hypothetical protein